MFSWWCDCNKEPRNGFTPHCFKLWENTISFCCLQLCWTLLLCWNCVYILRGIKRTCIKVVLNTYSTSLVKAMDKNSLWKHVFQNLLNIDTSLRTIINSGNTFQDPCSLVEKSCDLSLRRVYTILCDRKTLKNVLLYVIRTGKRWSKMKYISVDYFASYPSYFSRLWLFTVICPCRLCI